MLVLQQAEVDAQGNLRGWPCMRQLQFTSRTCLGQIQELPGQQELLAAYILGGWHAVQQILDARKAEG